MTNIEKLLKKLFPTNAELVAKLQGDVALTEEQWGEVNTAIDNDFVEPLYKEKFTKDGHNAAYGRAASELRNTLVKMGENADEIKELPFAELTKKVTALRSAHGTTDAEAAALKVELDNLKKLHIAELEAAKKEADAAKGDLDKLTKENQRKTDEALLASEFQTFATKNNLKPNASMLLKLKAMEYREKGYEIAIKNGSFVLKDAQGNFVTKDGSLQTLNEDFIKDAKDNGWVENQMPPKNTGTPKDPNEKKHTADESYDAILAGLEN
jgi:hypothetical protein